MNEPSTTLDEGPLSGTTHISTRSVENYGFQVRCDIEAEESRFSEYVATSKQPQGWWKTEPFTKSGRSRLKAKMMLLMSIPVAVLLGISFYFTINNIQQKTENDSLGTVIEQSRQFANVIHNLQKERDMSVLYLTGGCTKLPVIESYQKTSQALSKLSTWPVNSIKDFAEEFANREMFRQHLILHHKVLDLPDQNAYMEIQFYSRSINMMMTWLYDAIKKSNLGKTWTTIVSYLEIVGCTEYAGQMRSLGIIYFSPKGFSDHRAYGHFNKVSWPTRVNYELARRYSPLVMTLDLKQQMDSFSGYDLFGVINAYTYIIQNRAAGQIDDEHFWYSNMTNFINAMATVQGKLASELIEQFESRTFWIVVTIVTRAFLIVLVVAVSPVFLSRVYTIVCSIHENTHNSIGVTSSINRNRDRVESLFSVICTPKVVRLAIKKKTPKPAYFDHVTVMCVEVANFRQQAVRLHVLEVIACLDELVALLATKTALYGDIYRIQTAGHTLMVVAGVSGDDGSDEDHAKHVVSLALDILDETKNRNYKCSSYRKICVRIAVHTGECVSGMWIGRALTTSVTGAAVSHASDILGHAEVNRILVSDKTRDIVTGQGKDEFLFQPTTDATARDMGTYWLNGRLQAVEGDSQSQNNDKGFWQNESSGSPTSLGHRSTPHL